MTKVTMVLLTPTPTKAYDTNIMYVNEIEDSAILIELNFLNIHGSAGFFKIAN